MFFFVQCFDQFAQLAHSVARYTDFHTCDTNGGMKPNKIPISGESRESY